MVDVNGVIGQYAPQVWKWVAFGGTAIFGTGALYGCIWYFVNRKRYNFHVVLREMGIDGKPRITGYDRGGIFMDAKTQYRLFKLKKNKVGLSPDNIPYEEEPKGKVVNVLRLGLKQFRFLERPSITQNSPITLGYGIGDTDVAWGINSIELAKQYEKTSTLQKLLPFIGMAFVFLLVVVAMYYMFVKAGFNADLLKSLAASSEKISTNMASAASGTTVVGG
jgi:hypothetical protein